MIKIIINNLERYMRERGVNANTLSHCVGVKKETIKKYMRGSSEPPISVAILISDILLADVLDIWSVEIRS